MRVQDVFQSEWVDLIRNGQRAEDVPRHSVNVNPTAARPLGTIGGPSCQPCPQPIVSEAVAFRADGRVIDNLNVTGFTNVAIERVGGVSPRVNT